MITLFILGNYERNANFQTALTLPMRAMIIQFVNLNKGSILPNGCIISCIHEIC